MIHRKFDTSLESRQYLLSNASYGKIPDNNKNKFHDEKKSSKRRIKTMYCDYAPDSRKIKVQTSLCV